MTDEAHIARAGLLGAWDQLVGPGASTAENLGSLASGVAGAMIGLAGSTGGSASKAGWIKRGLAAALGADLFGGVWANATPTARWWYHGRGQRLQEAMAFSAAHLHPFLVAALWRERDWRFATGNYAYLLAATAVIASTPSRYRLPGALVLYSGALVLNTAVWKPTPGLTWFVPVFFLKLLVSHAALEAPSAFLSRTGHSSGVQASCPGERREESRVLRVAARPEAEVPPSSG